MSSVRTFIALFLIGTSLNASAGCFDFLFTKSDELIRVKAHDAERIQHYFPGQSLLVQTKRATQSGFLIRNSIHEVVLVDSNKNLIRIPAKDIQNMQVTQVVSEFPYPEHLDYLKKLHSARIQQSKLDPPAIWKKIQPKLSNEIENFRKISKKDQPAYLHRIGNEIIEKVKKAHGSSNIGFHYNLNGGFVPEYVEGGGIRISKGDIGLALGHGDPNQKVFFFQSDKISLYEILNESNPKQVMGGGRMGNSLLAFRLDGPYIKKAKLEKGIIGESNISFDFSENWVSHQPSFQFDRELIGIPATEYIAPPTVVFSNLKARVGMGSLSRNEETLATMRYLEDLWVTGH